MRRSERAEYTGLPRKRNDWQSLDELCEEYRGLLTRTVLHLAEDGPRLAVSFSGGVDSSSVLITYLEQGIPATPVCLRCGTTDAADPNTERARTVRRV